MPQQASIREKATDFMITTVVLTCINYFDLYSRHSNLSKRLLLSFIVASASAFILASIRPQIKTWMKEKFPMKQITFGELIAKFSIWTVLFTVVGLVDHYKKSIGWSTGKLLTRSVVFGLIMGAIFTLAEALIKKRRANRSAITTPPNA